MNPASSHRAPPPHSMPVASLRLAASKAPILLGVTDLACERRDRQLFSGLSFTVRGGEWIHVKGDNGSGKTTLLRVLCGLIPACAGEVLLAGEPLQGRLGDVRYLGHSPGVTGALTPLEHLETEAALHPGTAADHEKILHRVGLAEAAETPCHQLSAGQRRRVALARLVLSPGRLWILDEPLTSLDRAGIRLVHELLREHLGTGGAAVITTHHPLEMEPDDSVLLEEIGWTP